MWVQNSYCKTCPIAWRDILKSNALYLGFFLMSDTLTHSWSLLRSHSFWTINHFWKDISTINNTWGYTNLWNIFKFVIYVKVIRLKMNWSNLTVCRNWRAVDCTVNSIQTIHFGLRIALISKALAVISNCKCIVGLAFDRTLNNLLAVS
jgi:uncharacterized membrane protein